MESALGQSARVHACPMMARGCCSRRPFAGSSVELRRPAFFYKGRMLKVWELESQKGEAATKPNITVPLLGFDGSFTLTAVPSRSSHESDSSPRRLLYLCQGIGITPVLSNIEALASGAAPGRIEATIVVAAREIETDILAALVRRAAEGEYKQSLIQIDSHCSSGGRRGSDLHQHFRRHAQCRSGWRRADQYYEASRRTHRQQLLLARPLHARGCSYIFCSLHLRHPGIREFVPPGSEACCHQGWERCAV
jgi:hypothetical protein